MKSVKYSLYLDKRRSKGNNEFPLKLRIYFNGQARLFYTGEDIAADDFERSYLNIKPRNEFKDLKIKLNSIESKAKKIIDSLPVFTFEQFEKKIYQQRGNQDNVFYHYLNYIQKLNIEGRAATASNYDLSMKSMTRFITKRKPSPPSQLSFYEVTPTFLRRYEIWMLESGKSRTTVGFYLRPLRTIFNLAIQEGDIPKEVYPFGKNKFIIPFGSRVKKALSNTELQVLFCSPVAANSNLEKGKDFWFFSYNCNGINIKDLAELKYKNIQDNKVIFTRSKTKNTTRNAKPIIAHMNEFMKYVVEKYGNKKLNGDTYIFPILSENLSPLGKRNKIQNFTAYINDQIKKISKAAGLEHNITTYWARHSHATKIIRDGGSMEMVQENLGHSDLPTTQNYFAGFEDNTRKTISDKLMQFE